MIPIRNRPGLIDSCLASISALASSARPLEVIVVDDASTDDTADAAERWNDRLPVRVIRNPERKGPGAARNIGAAQAEGDILAFIDGDCVADRSWLADLLPAFEDETVVAVGGGLISAQERTWIQRYEGVSHPSQRGRAAAEVRPGAANDFLPGCNILVRRRAFQQIGGFDTTHHLGEDVDLTWRLARQAGRVLYQPDGRVAHEHVDDLASLLRRRFDLGTSHGLLLRRHPENRRSLGVSLAQLIAVVAAGAAAWQPWIAIVGVTVLVLDLVSTISAGRDGPASSERVAAWVKSHASVALRALSLIDQYFFLPLSVAGLVGGIFWSPLFLTPSALLANGLALGVVEWIRWKPGLDVVRFVLVRTVDRLALHAGILYGCLIHRTLAPLRIRLRIAASTHQLVKRNSVSAA